MLSNASVPPTSSVAPLSMRGTDESAPPHRPVPPAGMRSVEIAMSGYPPSDSVVAVSVPAPVTVPAVSVSEPTSSVAGTLSVPPSTRTSPGSPEAAVNDPLEIRSRLGPLTDATVTAVLTCASVAAVPGRQTLSEAPGTPLGAQALGSFQLLVTVLTTWPTQVLSHVAAAAEPGRTVRAATVTATMLMRRRIVFS